MNFIKDENGQGMVEYALIIGLIAVVAVVVIVALSPKVKNSFDTPNKAVDDATRTN